MMEIRILAVVRYSDRLYKLKREMNSKLIMIASAIMLCLIGVTLTFLAAEVLAYLDISTSKVLQLLIQILGSLFFAFSILNWMAKGSIIGGIYNRPIALANFAHFVIGGLTLAKAVMNNSERSYITYALTGVYLLFAILFGMIFFRSPTISNTVNSS